MTNFQAQARNLARISPAGYAWYCSNGYWKPAPHHKLLNRCLIDLALRKYHFLIVTMPPQNGKSTLISQYFTGWYLGNFSNDRVILASYEAEKAEEWGAKAKDTFTEYGQELFGLTLKQDTKRKSYWRIDGYNGSMSTAGIGGPITGKSGDLIVIDDPVKNAEEANSKAVQERNWDWWRTVAFTRRQPGAIVVIPMTRWSKNDLVGKILDSPLGKSCHVLNLEGICESPDDPLGRKIGEPLWPERFPLKMMEEFRDTLGPYWWDALYMGRPNDPLGSLFKSIWFLTFREDDDHYLLSDGRTFLKKNCYIMQTIDPAATTNKQSDYFVLLTVAVTPDKDILVLHVFRDKIGADQYEPVIREHYNRFHPSIIGVENKTFGLTIMQQLKKYYPFRPCEADQDKLARSMTAQARYSLGKVFHKVDTYGNKSKDIEEFEKELKEFPTGTHDDQVDTISYTAIMVMMKKTINVR